MLIFPFYFNIAVILFFKYVVSNDTDFGTPDEPDSSALTQKDKPSSAQSTNSPGNHACYILDLMHQIINLNREMNPSFKILAQAESKAELLFYPKKKLFVIHFRFPRRESKGSNPSDVGVSSPTGQEPIELQLDDSSIKAFRKLKSGNHKICSDRCFLMQKSANVAHDSIHPPPCSLVLTSKRFKYILTPPDEKHYILIFKFFDKLVPVHEFERILELSSPVGFPQKKNFRQICKNTRKRIIDTTNSLMGGLPRIFAKNADKTKHVTELGIKRRKLLSLEKPNDLLLEESSTIVPVYHGGRIDNVIIASEKRDDEIRKTYKIKKRLLIKTSNPKESIALDLLEDPASHQIAFAVTKNLHINDLRFFGRNRAHTQMSRANEFRDSRQMKRLRSSKDWLKLEMIPEVEPLSLHEADSLEDETLDRDSLDGSSIDDDSSDDEFSRKADSNKLKQPPKIHQTRINDRKTKRNTLIFKQSDSSSTKSKRKGFIDDKLRSDPLPMNLDLDEAKRPLAPTNLFATKLEPQIITTSDYASDNSSDDAKGSSSTVKSKILNAPLNNPRSLVISKYLAILKDGQNKKDTSKLSPANKKKRDYAGEAYKSIAENKQHDKDTKSVSTSGLSELRASSTDGNSEVWSRKRVPRLIDFYEGNSNVEIRQLQSVSAA